MRSRACSGGGEPLERWPGLARDHEAGILGCCASHGEQSIEKSLGKCVAGCGGTGQRRCCGESSGGREPRARTGHGEVCSWPVVRSQTAVHGAADLCRGESSGCGEQRGQDWAHRSVRVAGGAIADCDGTREMKGCCARESSDGRSRRHEDCSGMRPVSARLPRGRARRQGAGHCKVCRRCAVAVCGSTRQQQKTLCQREQRRRRAGRENWLEGQCLLGCREAEREGREPGTAKCAGGVLSRCAAARGSSRDAVHERSAVAESRP